MYYFLVNIYIYTHHETWTADVWLLELPAGAPFSFGTGCLVGADLAGPFFGEPPAVSW